MLIYIIILVVVAIVAVVNTVFLVHFMRILRRLTEKDAVKKASPQAPEPEHEPASRTVPPIPVASPEAELVMDRMKLLVVDDDPHTRESLASFFKDEYDVRTAENGIQALAVVEEMIPDIVISDIVMPQMDGLEFCYKLKSSVETSHIPVVMLTAMRERECIIQGLEAGATDYVIKPCDYAILKLRLKNIIRHLRSQMGANLVSDYRPAGMKFSNTIDKQFMDRVSAAVERHIANNELQVEDICREVGMSRTAFFNKIKALTGRGPNDYIRVYRLNRASELLSSGKYSVLDVSDMVGFSDAKYFTVCYKKHFGINPRKQ